MSMMPASITQGEGMHSHSKSKNIVLDSLKKEIM